MELDYIAIGKRIKKARNAKHLTQDQVADRTGLSNPHISNIETGNTKLSLQTLIKVANTLDVTADELLCDNVAKSEQIFEIELQEILRDCSAEELKAISEIATTLKNILRRTKMNDSNKSK